MKVTSLLLGEMSGSLGAITASHNRYGAYLREKVVPVNPDSTRQNTIRAVFATLVNLWTNVLLQTERNAWDNWAANTPIDGENITGQNAYIRANAPRLQGGLARVDAAPIIFDNGNPVSKYTIITSGLADVIGINLAGDAMAIQAAIDGLASDDGDVLLYLGATVNASRKFFAGPYQLASVDAVAADAVGVVITTAISALLSDNGDPAVNQFRAIRAIVAYDDGRLSLSTKLLSTVLADTI